MKKILTLLAAGLLGLCQAYAQEATAEELYKNTERYWTTSLKISIGHTDYYNVGRIPEHQVRLDYYLCKALTHEVVSVETRTISFNANDFSEKSILLTPPAGFQIRDDVHYDIQMKSVSGGQFRTVQHGFRESYLKNNDQRGGPMYRHTNLYVSKDMKEIGVMTGEFNPFYEDNLTGAEFNRKYNPKNSTKIYAEGSTYFLIDDNGYVRPIDEKDRNAIRPYVGAVNQKDGKKRYAAIKWEGSDMWKGNKFWPRKVNKNQVKHTQTFRLQYEGGQVPSNMKFYMTIESPLYYRDGTFSSLANAFNGDGITLELSSSNRNGGISGTFNMRDDERVFVYPFWMVTAEDLSTGEIIDVAWGLLNLTNASSEYTHTLYISGNLKDGTLKVR